MRCPWCHSLDNKVIDSRMSRDGLLIRRRRVCDKCQRRFTTYERIEEMMPMVVKRDGRREPYDREKILQGLKIACRKRPVPTQTLEELVDGIEHKIHDLGLKEISSKEIGEEIISRLKEIDPIAYVRFASVYRSFTDAKEFIREIQEVLPSARDDQSTREPQARG